MMLRFFALIVCLAASSTVLSADQAKEFSYSANEKRDPLWPLVNANGTIVSYNENLNYDDLVLEGIVYDQGGKSLAIINGKIFKSNSNVAGYVILRIESDRVVLSKDDQEFILDLRKGR